MKPGAGRRIIRVFGELWFDEDIDVLRGADESVEKVVDGVRIPYLGLDALIASKETYREQDAADRLRLLALKQRR